MSISERKVNQFRPSQDNTGPLTAEDLERALFIRYLHAHCRQIDEWNIPHLTSAAIEEAQAIIQEGPLQKPSAVEIMVGRTLPALYQKTRDKMQTGAEGICWCLKLTSQGSEAYEAYYEVERKSCVDQEENHWSIKFYTHHHEPKEKYKIEITRYFPSGQIITTLYPSGKILLSYTKGEDQQVFKEVSVSAENPLRLVHFKNLSIIRHILTQYLYTDKHL